MSAREINDAEHLLRITFPVDYRQYLRLYHGGHPDPWAFPSEEAAAGTWWIKAGVLLSLRPFRVGPTEMPTIQDLTADVVASQKLPQWVIPIIADASGDLVCLDYRNDPQRKCPAIVFWCKDIPGEPGLLPVAASFSGFLSILKEKRLTSPTDNQQMSPLSPQEKDPP